MTDIAETGRHILVVEDDPTNRSVMAQAPAAGPRAARPGQATIDAPPVFDLRALQDIVGEEPAVLLEIVAYFDTVSIGIRAELLQVAAAADPITAAMLAHTLKSSSRAVGALRLGALCEVLEAHGAAGRSDRVAPLVGDVVDALDAALAAMRGWLGAQPPAAPLMTRYGL
jgi:HPt (histidine-containing phosphotransfer) domain-containing protein